MFSKFGKLLTYQFHILLSKDEILSPGKHSRTPIKPKKRSNKKESSIKTILDSEMPSAQSDTKKENPPKVMPMFRSQSREDFYRVNYSKDNVPPIGYYNYKYDYVTKSPTSVIFQKRARTASKIKPELEPSDSFMKYTPTKKNSVIAFKKQTARKNIFIKELNENRFVSYNCMPEVCSNFKRVNSPDINKLKGRENLIKEPEYCNSYDADFKLVTQDLGKVHEFSKYTQRKKLFPEKEDCRNYEVNWESVEKKKYSADFSKICSKVKDDSLS